MSMEDKSEELSAVISPVATDAGEIIAPGFVDWDAKEDALLWREPSASAFIPPTYLDARAKAKIAITAILERMIASLKRNLDGLITDELIAKEIDRVFENESPIRERAYLLHREALEKRKVDRLMKTPEEKAVVFACSLAHDCECAQAGKIAELPSCVERLRLVKLGLPCDDILNPPPQADIVRSTPIAPRALTAITE